MGVDITIQYNGYNSYKFNQNDFLICYPFGVENMEYITHSFGAYSPIGLGSKVRAKTRFFNADGEEIKLENHSFAVQQGTFDKVEITVSVPALAVKAELTFLNNEAQPWWVATPKTEEGQTATPYAINAYGQLTYITPNGIYTGTITANQIVLASGGSLPDRLTKINANGVYTGEIVADQIDFDGAKGDNVELTGKITATSGKIGNFLLEDGVLSIEYESISKVFVMSDYNRLNSILGGNITPTIDDFKNYDINRDGKLSSIDAIRISKAVNGTSENPIPLKNKIMVGTKTGEIKVYPYYKDSGIWIEGSPSTLSANGMVNGISEVNTLVAKDSLYFQGQRIYIDSSGTLKAIS